MKSYSQYSDQRELEKHTQRRSLYLHEVLVRTEILYGDAQVMLDACVAAEVTQTGTKGMDVTEISIRDIYIVAPGLEDELILLDKESFESRQTGLYGVFMKDVEAEVLKQAKDAKGDEWSYESGDE